MTALSLFNRHLDNFESSYANPFFKSVWFKDLETGALSGQVNFRSQLKFDDKSSRWELTLETCGVLKDKLKMDVKEGLLVISGDKSKGIALGPFEKQLQIPEGVDIEKIEAHFDDGILTVLMPLESKKSNKEITIK